MEVIILVGISGSEKSSWCSNFIKNNPNYLRINRDDIRKTLVGDLEGYYGRKDMSKIESKINLIEEDIFNTLVSNDYNIIIDNTNLKQSYINKWLSLYNKEDSLKFKLFDISLEESKKNVIDRNNWRISPSSLVIPYTYHWNKVSYIDKQLENYQRIKEWLQINYKDQII